MRLAGKKIMLIDDDVELRLLLMRVLKGAGCEVESCSSIKEAMTQLTAKMPDLVILDLSMPELDGFTFLKFRQQNKLLAQIPVLILSGTKKKEEILKALEMGAHQFLEKPFESRLILQKLRYIFHSKEELSFQFPESSRPTVDAEMQATLIEHSTDRLKIESQIKFCAGKTVQLILEDYVKNEGKTLLCRVDNRLVEIKDGFFRTVLDPAGLDAEEKKKLELWQRSLS